MLCFKFVGFLLLSSLLLFVGCGPPPKEHRVLEQRTYSGAQKGDDESINGQCSDELVASLRAPINEYHITNCPRSVWGDKNRTMNCLRENIPALRNPAAAGCVGCFGQVTECASANCKMACLTGSCSSGCRSCVENNCGAAFKQCTGQPEQNMPQCRANRP